VRRRLVNRAFCTIPGLPGSSIHKSYVLTPGILFVAGLSLSSSARGQRGREGMGDGLTSGRSPKCQRFRLASTMSNPRANPDDVPFTEGRKGLLAPRNLTVSGVVGTSTPVFVSYFANHRQRFPIGPKLLRQLARMDQVPVNDRLSFKFPKRPDFGPRFYTLICTLH
jgi:hypothetical protein